MCAGKAKSVYLTIVPKGKLQSVFSKVFFDAKGLRDYMDTEEFKAKWPATEFEFVKETY